ncbi:hypothetical protein SK128_018180, partial [Halocaridina rubra]
MYEELKIALLNHKEHHKDAGGTESFMIMKSGGNNLGARVKNYNMTANDNKELHKESAMSETSFRIKME